MGWERGGGGGGGSGGAHLHQVADNSMPVEVEVDQVAADRPSGNPSCLYFGGHGLVLVRPKVR